MPTAAYGGAGGRERQSTNRTRHQRRLVLCLFRPPVWPAQRAGRQPADPSHQLATARSSPFPRFPVC